MASDRIQQRVRELLRECLGELQNEIITSGVTSTPAPPTEITRLDRDLACLRGIRKAISTEVSARIAHVSARRNSLLPIHRLPPEILSRILEESLDHFDAVPGHRTTQRLRTLSSVARLWKDILDQTPAAWGWVDDLRDASFAMYKSRTSPLWIDLTEEGALDPAELGHALSILSPHSKRWKALRLFLTKDSVEEFDRVMESLPTPLLQDLGLIGEGASFTHARISPNFNRFPLRHLELRRVWVPWDSVARLEGLRSLSITGLEYEDVWPSRDHITSILLGCSRLEALTLSRLENHPTDHTLPAPVAPTFHLPALKSIALHDILNTREAALWLLDGVVAPNLTGLSISGVSRNRDIGPPIASVLRRQSPESPLPIVMASCRQHAVQVLITFRGVWITCNHVVKKHTHRGVEIYLPVNSPEDACGMIVKLLPWLAGGVPLHLHFAGPDPDPYSALLPQFPSLHVLRIEQPSNTAALLRYLGSKSCERQDGYPCESLTEVRLLGTYITRNEETRQAANVLIERRPSLVLYSEEGRHSALDK